MHGAAVADADWRTIVFCMSKQAKSGIRRDEKGVYVVLDSALWHSAMSTQQRLLRDGKALSAANLAGIFSILGMFFEFILVPSPST